MSEQKPLRPNVGIALFGADGRVLIGRRFRDDGPEIIFPGLEWQMPQGGVDEGEDHRAAAFRELWEETSVRNADYLGETDWLVYEFPPYDGPPHRLSKFRGQRQKWFALRFSGRDEEIDPLTPRNGQPAGIRCVAMGTARSGRRSRGAVPARGLSRGGHKFREVRAALKRDDCSSNRHPALLFLFEHDLFGKPLHTFPDHALIIRPDHERPDRDHVAIAVALAAIAERVVDGVLLGCRLQPEPRTPRGADGNRIPSRGSSGQLARRHRRARQRQWMHWWPDGRSRSPS